MELEAPTAMDAWKATLHHILTDGHVFTDDDKRTCREVLNLSVTITHPEVGIEEPIDALRRIDKWVYPSKEELTAILFDKDEAPVYEYTYGSRIFGYHRIHDQVNEYIIPLLKCNPSSRRATMITIDPARDLALGNRNTPGLISLHFRLHEGKLLLTTILRSNDYFIGWPANIYQIASLQRYVAERLEVRCGPLTTYSVSAHIFKEYEEDIKGVLEK